MIVFRKITVVMAATMLVFFAGVLVGRATADDRPVASTSSSASTSLPSWREKLGCVSVTEEGTEEDFALDLYTCTKADGSKSYVYTFVNKQSRDSWRSIAEIFGSVVFNSGDTWLETN